MATITNPRAAELTRGALAKRTGCNAETIRYYEKIGLLPAPPRSPGGHRLYGEDHFKRLTFICRARELGFGLKDVRQLLGLADGCDHTCGEVKALTLEHVRDIRRKIADLRRIGIVLEAMAEKCDAGEVPECPIIDALYREGRLSPP